MYSCDSLRKVRATFVTGATPGSVSTLGRAQIQLHGQGWSIF